MTTLNPSTIATNGHPGATLGAGWPPNELPHFLALDLVALGRESGWRVAFWDGDRAMELRDFDSKAEAVDYACAHAETLRYPVLFVETAT